MQYENRNAFLLLLFAVVWKIFRDAVAVENKKVG